MTDSYRIKKSGLISEDDNREPSVDNEVFFRLFERQVECTPDAVAVEFRSEQLTYSDLNKRANQLAYFLRTIGVRPEVPVGICMKRCNLMLIGMLGILKAGGAYVPFDPQYPEDRLQFMIEDTEIKVLLTQSDLKLKLPVEQTICLDTEWEIIRQLPTGNIESGATAANLAYIIYTSGSTGKPKGAAIEHRGVAGLMRWGREEFGDQTLAGTLAATSICFDMSVFELFAPLSCGGTAILTENILHLATVPAANKIALISTVPSVISEILQFGWLPENTRAILLAGEALQENVARQIFSNTRIQRVWNLYGLSEDTCYTTSALITRDHTGPVTIGRPITYREVYVLGDDAELAPPGASGELYVSGIGLARGYVNRPELTAERFIPNPFSTSPGARMYRTGDIVRYTADGALEYLGRKDHQLKIRGYRIEVGEIEAVLGAHSDVKTCAVVLREDMAGEKQLAAFVVPKEQKLSVSELYNYLSAMLPKWMVPSITLIDQMPVTANGKVDRQSLQARGSLEAK